MESLLFEKIAVKTALTLIKINAVNFRFHPPFTFTSGIKSPIYLDNRVVLSYPQARREIVDYYVKIIKEKIGLENIDYISGTASAAIPQASLIAYRLKLPLVYVRPTTKSYGKGNKLEGYLKKGSKVVIIEDHISTAASSVNNAQTVRELGGKVTYCLATTTYESQISKNNLADNKIKLIALTTGKIIIQEAFKKKLLKIEEKNLIDLWFKNPAKWAENISKKQI